jgi:hypothetical protein
MNNKLSKALIEHYNTCFLTLKGIINIFQKTWKLHIFWNVLHKPWHNNIKKNYIYFLRMFWGLFKNLLKNDSSKSLTYSFLCICLVKWNRWLYTYITGVITVKEPPDTGFDTFAEVHPTSRMGAFFSDLVQILIFSSRGLRPGLGLQIRVWSSTSSSCVCVLRFTLRPLPFFCNLRRLHRIGFVCRR